MKTISFKIKDKEYEELKKNKDRTWYNFFLGTIQCPYCGQLFLSETGWKLKKESIDGKSLSNWPFMQKREREHIDDDLIESISYKINKRRLNND